MQKKKKVLSFELNYRSEKSRAPNNNYKEQPPLQCTVEVMTIPMHIDSDIALTGVRFAGFSVLYTALCPFF